MKTLMAFCAGFFSASALIEAFSGEVRMAIVYGVCAFASLLTVVLKP